jgi:glycosyltransferase involved in cell wall biosynthesis
MASYNYETYLPAALDSVLAQTYPHFEEIVCDDGSVDDSVAIARGYAARDDRISVITKPNGGAASALNRAFASSTGDLVCLLDADDVFAPEKLAATVDAFSTQGCGFLVHPLIVVDASGVPIQRKPAYGTLESGDIRDRVVARGGRWSYMEASSICMRREVAQRLFPIDEDVFRTWADAYLCVAGGLITDVGHLDDALTDYRVHGANVSGFSEVSYEQVEAGKRSFKRLVDGVNAWISAQGGSQRLDVADNLAFLENEYLGLLLGGHEGRLGLLRALIPYLGSVLKDEIYSPIRKLLTVIFMTTAIALPVARRGAWVSKGLTPSRLKERVRRILASPSRVRASVRSGRAASGQ